MIPFRITLLNQLAELRRPPEPIPPPVILPATVRGAGIKHGSPGQSLRDLRDRVNHEQRHHRDPVAALEEELMAEEAAATAEAILAAAARAD